MSRAREQTQLVNALTVDVEDYFQVSAFEGHISRDDWNTLSPRVEHNTHRILDLFADRGALATFFVLGWVAERFPTLLRRMTDEGHEVASHGMIHQRANTQDQATFADDVRRSRALLQDTSGQAVRGYRAASFSIGRGNLWALEELQAAGYAYSSSIYPVKHDLYGMPDAPRFPFKPLSGDLLEVPVSTVRMGARNLPVGGGGYFRLLPYQYYLWGINHLNRTEKRPSIFYFHPWEIDPGQPRQAALPFKSRLRHYMNLSRTEARLGKLLGDFRWGRMDEVFLPHADSAEHHSLELAAEAA